MKIGLICDTHWGVRSDKIEFLDANEKFVKEQFIPTLLKEGVDTVVHLGDLLDRRKYTNNYTLTRVRKDFIDPLLNNEIKYHQILGNHDTYYKNTNEVSAVTELLRDLPVCIYKNATDEPIFDGTKILFVPWICDDNRQQTLELIRKTNAQICFGHLELVGFEMYKGSIMSHGDSPNLFNSFDIVLSGHYHHRSSSDNIHYLGCHAEFTWADYNDTKGFHIFDTKTRELQFVKNTQTMFEKLWYDDTKEINVDVEKYRNKYVKVITTNKTDTVKFDKFITNLESVNPIDLTIVEDHLNIHMEEDADIIDEAESTVEAINLYIDQLSTKINKDKLKAKMLELYSEAQTLE